MDPSNTIDDNDNIKQLNNDEVFRQIHELSNTDKNIKNETDIILSEITESQITKEIERRLSIQIIKEIEKQLPIQVTKEIKIQILSYLNQNYQMQQILDDHKLALRNQLESVVGEILNKFIDDPNYHKIIDAYISLINSKEDEKMKQIEKNTEKQLNEHIYVFNNELEQMKKNSNRNLFELQNYLERTKDLKQEVSNLREKHSADISDIRWTLLGVSTLAITIFATLLVTK